MSVFVLTLIAVAAAALGGREAVRVARLSAALGASPWLALAFWIACIAACVFAGQMGGWIAARLDLGGQAIVAAVALLLAALDLALRRPGKPPAEPTRSFGAIVLVLGAGQLTSATGLVVFALAVVADAYLPIVTGGVLGAGGVLTCAMRAKDRWEARPLLEMARPVVSLLLLVAAVAAGLPAMELTS